MKKLLSLMVAASVLAVSSGVQAMGSKPVETVAAQPAKQAVKAKGVWIDVRSPEEFEQGHLQGALNIPADQIAERIKSISPDKNAPVNLYCRSGRRAEAALQALKQAGYTNVTNHGGYQDLLKKGIR
ncbi:rhodanese-like domain-containing protein [Neisseria animalis]|uniref:Rhodanese-like domain-containing protein n=1 Tax=Neisseria animalis TaxID=492 RepID=A0A5P3MSD3_NEIAN|nr:rhodanese-like domain-containing protein [Neisseria animalis]QEY24513.1 rhodanese-like domain-containing protein [Neisseria animalis]ROW33069.1 rhodanese-like domain-containing protein [Neisseria animalis]VEE07236.1 putative phage shock protein E [Neisseria animalis]